jgi:hypothetical protein
MSPRKCSLDNLLLVIALCFAKVSANEVFPKKSELETFLKVLFKCQ